MQQQDSIGLFFSGDIMVFNFLHCTEVHFASFLSGGFTAIAVINPPKSKLAKCTSVQCNVSYNIHFVNVVKCLLLSTLGIQERSVRYIYRLFA